LETVKLNTASGIYLLVPKVKRMFDLKRIFRRDEVGSVARRFFINTLFDSTFMLLGIIVGIAFSSGSNLNVIIVTMLTSSLALGISTGVSVYEAESLEQERKILDLEKALFQDLSGTKIEKESKSIVILTALLNLCTPLLSCTIIIFPFTLVFLQILNMDLAPWLSAILALAMLFCAGVYLGKFGGKNPWIKGLRMVGFGLIAFIIGFFLNTLV